MNNMINFDSRDWNSIRGTIDKINQIGCMQIGETSEGEDITFDVMNNGINDILKTETHQKNGWIHINYYDPWDRTIEETYKRE